MILSKPADAVGLESIYRAKTDEADKKPASVYEPSAVEILQLQIARTQEGTSIFTLLTSFLKALTDQLCV